MSQHNPVIIAGFGRFGNIVGRLLRANGIETTVLDIDSDNVDMLRKLGMEVYYGDACRKDLLEAAGADNASIIVVAIDDSDKALDLVQTVKKHFPHLNIFARASGRAEAYDLLEEGVAHVFRETFETSLRVGVEVLRASGIRAYLAERSARSFRRHDNRDLRELAGFHHDKKKYISKARHRIADLEAAMLTEIEKREQHRDAGWDIESLREENSAD